MGLRGGIKMGLYEVKMRFRGATVGFREVTMGFKGATIGFRMGQ